jgi:hypothetical protein
MIAEVGDGDREIDWELERKMEEPERKQEERLIR